MKNNFERTQDQDFDNKFFNLYNNILGQYTKKKETFDELEKLTQKKYSDFILKVNTKAEAKCKDQVETMFLYSEFKKKNTNDENKQILNKNNPEVVALPGYEKEFSEAKNNLNECTDKYFAINDELNNVTGIINNLVLNSNQSCLIECQNDIKKYRHTDYEAGKCIQSCLKYRNYNLQAHFKLIFEAIDEFQNMTDKL